MDLLLATAFFIIAQYDQDILLKQWQLQNCQNLQNSANLEICKGHYCIVEKNFDILGFTARNPLNEYA